MNSQAASSSGDQHMPVDCRSLRPRRHPAKGKQLQRPPALTRQTKPWVCLFLGRTRRAATFNSLTAACAPGLLADVHIVGKRYAWSGKPDEGIKPSPKSAARSELMRSQTTGAGAIQFQPSRKAHSSRASPTTQFLLRTVATKRRRLSQEFRRPVRISPRASCRHQFRTGR